MCPQATSHGNKSWPRREARRNKQPERSRLEDCRAQDPVPRVEWPALADHRHPFAIHRGQEAVQKSDFTGAKETVENRHAESRGVGVSPTRFILLEPRWRDSNSP